MILSVMQLFVSSWIRWAGNQQKGVFMKLFMLAKSSIKKSRSSAITLFLLIIIATIFLYTGFTVLLGIDRFMDQKNESINGAGFVAFVPEMNADHVESILGGMEKVKELETEEAVLYNSAQVQNKRVEDKAQSIGIIFLNSDTKRTYSKVNAIGAEGPMSENSIIVPYCLKTSYGYAVGDEIEVTYDNNTLTYVIYGFSEDILFSSAANISYFKLFVPDQEFKQRQAAAVDNSKAVYFKAALVEGTSTEDFEDTFDKLASQDSSFDSSSILGLNYDIMKIGATATVNIIMMVIIFFAALILIISMVVIRYTVITHIEEDIRNIGSMEAIGFTNAMIRSSLILQFLSIAFLGYVVGIAVSIGCSGAVTGIISASIGLNWNANTNPVTLLITFIVIFLLIIAITVKVTHRIGKITPLMALRSGINTFHFGKNHFPLDTAHGNLHLILGLKQIFHNKKQSLSVGIIGILMSFTMVFSFAMYHNFVVNDKAFLTLIGSEKADIAVLYYQDQYEEVFEKAAAVDGVARSVRYSSGDVAVTKNGKEFSTAAFICNDFSSTEISTVIDGRYPKHDNEIALSTLIAKKLNAAIGDIVTINNETEGFDYLVVGMTQHINQLGQSVSLTEEGMKLLNPSYVSPSLYLYLEEGQDAEAVITKLTDTLKGYEVTIANVADTFATTMSSITQSISLICIIIALITSLIIVLILYYLVKVKILNEKINLGIHKALGFTTGQLVMHNNINVCSLIVASTILGSILAAVTINPLCVLMLSVSGIQNCSFQVPISLVLITIGIMTALTLTTTTLVSVRIRHVNPRELITD